MTTLKESKQEVKVLPYGNTYRLNEVYQSVDLKFSFLTITDKGDYQEMNPPCKCRDYLHDIINSTIHKVPFAIYGMEFDGSKTPIDLDVTRFYLRFSNLAQKIYFLANLPFLHQIEQKGGFGESSVIDVDKVSLIITGDKSWMNNTVLISLYSFLLRLMCYPKPLAPTGEGNKDLGYLNKLREEKYFDQVLENVSLLKTTNFSGWSGMYVQHLHDYSGILTFLGSRPGHCHLTAHNSIYKEYLEKKVVGY